MGFYLLNVHSVSWFRCVRLDVYGGLPSTQHIPTQTRKSWNSTTNWSVLSGKSDTLLIMRIRKVQFCGLLMGIILHFYPPVAGLSDG